MSKVKSIKYDEPNYENEKNLCRVWVDLDGVYLFEDHYIKDALISYWYKGSGVSYRIHVRTEDDIRTTEVEFSMSDDPLFVYIARFVARLEEKP